MKKRRFGRLGWQVSEIGYGMWGMVAWTGSDEASVLAALDRAVERGCNFFDTAYAYGEGRSERLLGETLRRHRGMRLYTASKVPPKNRVWPGRAETPVAEAFSYEHIVAMTEASLRNLGEERLDLQQLHVWSDAWAEDEGWQRAASDLKKRGLIAGLGISVNRWEPTNVARALETGLVDAVQVVYNVFDQDPEDELFPLCQRLDVALVARVPFDEGSLTGTLRAGQRWPEGDWRNRYFAPAHLEQALPRVEALERLVPEGGTLPELALRFVLHNTAVSTTIPGMRSVAHVEANLAASAAPPLPPGLLEQLRAHRWRRDWQLP